MTLFCAYYTKNTVSEIFRVKNFHYFDIFNDSPVTITSTLIAFLMASSLLLLSLEGATHLYSPPSWYRTLSILSSCEAPIGSKRPVPLSTLAQQPLIPGKYGPDLHLQPYLCNQPFNIRMTGCIIMSDTLKFKKYRRIISILEILELEK